jgi:hypothetical protein
VSGCATRFFLTGGTAISRGYYGHRYSDDLDFFTNKDPDYARQVELILNALKNAGFKQDKNSDFINKETFVSIKIRHRRWDCALKLDFVNDIAPRFGDIIKTDLFDRTDSIRNILSNKITALYRYEPKDIADIREIALHNSFNWADVVKEAGEKEGGMDVPMMAQIIKGMPEQKFTAIKWINKQNWRTFSKDIEVIVQDLLKSEDNSLNKNRAKKTLAVSVNS